MLQWDRQSYDLDHQPVINSVTFYSRIYDIHAVVTQERINVVKYIQ